MVAHLVQQGARGWPRAHELRRRRASRTALGREAWWPRYVAVAHFSPAARAVEPLCGGGWNAHGRRSAAGDGVARRKPAGGIFSMWIRLLNRSTSATLWDTSIVFAKLLVMAGSSELYLIILHCGSCARDQIAVPTAEVSKMLEVRKMSYYIPQKRS